MMKTLCELLDYKYDYVTHIQSIEEAVRAKMTVKYEYRRLCKITLTRETVLSKTKYITKKHINILWAYDLVSFGPEQ